MILQKFHLMLNQQQFHPEYQLKVYSMTYMPKSGVFKQLVSSQKSPYGSRPAPTGEFWQLFLPIATLKRSCYFLYIFNKVIYICNKDATVFEDFSGDGRLFCKKKK